MQDSRLPRARLGTPALSLFNLFFLQCASILLLFLPRFFANEIPTFESACSLELSDFLCPCKNCQKVALGSHRLQKENVGLYNQKKTPGIKTRLFSSFSLSLFPLFHHLSLPCFSVHPFIHNTIQTEFTYDYTTTMFTKSP